MRHTDAHDEELVRRTLDGDRTSFDQLVARYRNAVYRFACHLLGDFGELDKFEEAEDAAQDAFISAYLQLHQLKNFQRFAAWLRIITHNVCSSRIRLAKRLKTERTHLEKMDAPETYGPARRTEIREIDTFVRKALRSLPEKSRLTLTMSLIDGFSYAEIADFLDISIGTVKSRLNYARNKLREELYAMVEDNLKLDELDGMFDARVREEIDSGESRISTALANGLKRADERLGKIALRVLAKAMDQKTEEPVISVLADGDDETRLLACRLIAEIGSCSAIRPLLDLLKGKNSQVQAAAALALGRIAPGGKRGLSERERSNAPAVWTELDAPTVAEIVENLGEVLRTGIPGARVNAATALGMKGTPEAIEILAAALKNEQHRQVLKAIVGALNMTFSRQAYEACVAFGRSNREISTGLPLEGSRPLVFYDLDELERLCRDTGASESRRAYSIGLLYKTEGNKALDLMLNLLSDPSDRVVKAVEREISNRLPELARDDHRARAALENMAAHHSSTVRRRWAHRSLAKLANPPEEQALADLAAQARTWKAQDAKILAQVGSPRAIEALHEALVDTNPLLCVSTMEGLMLSKAPFSRKMIETAMTQDHPPMLRHYAKLIMENPEHWKWRRGNFGICNIYWRRHSNTGASVFALLPPEHQYPIKLIEDAMSVVLPDHNAGVRALADFGLIERSHGVCRLTEEGQAAAEIERTIWEAAVAR